MGKDKLFGGIEVAFALAFCKVRFFVQGQHGDAVDGVDILFEAAVAALNGR